MMDNTLHPASEKPLSPLRPVHDMLQRCLPGVERGLGRLSGAAMARGGGFFQNRQKPLAEPFRHRQAVRVHIDHLAGGAQQSAGGDDVVRQGGHRRNGVG